MSHTWKAMRKTAVAAGVATVLASAIAPTRMSLAAASPPQEPSKAMTKEVKVEEKGKVGVIKQAVPVPVIELEAQVIVNGNAVPAPDLAPILQNMIHQLTPILRSELRTLTLSAQPTPTQRREIAMEGGRTLKMVADNMARNRNWARGVNRRVGSATSDPRKLIHDSIEAEAKAKLSPEQFAHYQSELKGKSEERREVVILNLAAKIEKALLLSVDQRDRLCDSLRSSWNDQSSPSVETLEAYEQYYPITLDPQLNPILTEAQRKIWQGLPKLNFAGVRNAGFFPNIPQVEVADQDGDEDLKAALAEVPKQ